MTILMRYGMKRPLRHRQSRLKSWDPGEIAFRIHRLKMFQLSPVDDEVVPANNPFH